MKTAISLPDDLFDTAEQTASRLGISRSVLYQRALALFLERHGDALVTDSLNEVYSTTTQPPLDPLLDRMQRASLAREHW